ncbi:LacI family DNA-binding transcriptional regulator [Sporolactobacillus terrae]|uniref:LacI family DNA-binding transcriptional regulator n=1 Tax=Sporolactobacillus terrae TaxID=269673 RepID=UPI001CBE2401|nr:LacI family DNA-binding transcriptional regulator [Sporolactobacillus terrae]
MKNITIKEVSKRANVSTATVSRVLNNNYPVREETRAKVLKAVRELNFSPSHVARNLRTHQSDLVAMVVADITNSYYAKIAKIVDQHLFIKGYNLLVCSTDESQKKEKQFLNMLIKKNVDAVAISSVSKNAANIQTVIDNGIKVVLLDRKHSGLRVPYVGNDNAAESYLLTEHLIQMGHEKIALVSGPLHTSTGFERLQGYREALMTHGLQVQEKLILEGDYSRDSGYKSMKKIIMEVKDVTGVVSSNNLMTEGILHAVKSEGRRIPEDYSVVSFGSIDNDDLITPKICCIDQDSEAIGNEVSKQLLDLLNSSSQSENSVSRQCIVYDRFVPGESVRRIE